MDAAQEGAMRAHHLPLLLFLVLLPFCLGLYEDEAGAFDWYGPGASPLVSLFSALFSEATLSPPPPSPPLSGPLVLLPGPI